MNLKPRHLKVEAHVEVVVAAPRLVATAFATINWTLYSISHPLEKYNLETHILQRNERHY